MADRVRIAVRRCPSGEGLPLPAMGSDGASGFDLRAAVDGDIELQPGERRLVPTGIALELPRGTEGQVRPRSGLASRYGITVLNAPGTIDSDYRGEVGVLLIHHGSEPFPIRRGDRIAQLVFARTIDVELGESDDLAPSGRGAGGFGSTGVD